MPGVCNWSRDATSNDVSDPPILWVEGQPAQTVNNSNRAMMAAVALWRDDNIGIQTANRDDGDAYRISTLQGFNAPAAAAGHTVSFRVASVNRGPATLSLDGQAAKPILRGGFLQLGPGDISGGIVYSVAFIPSEDAYLILSPTIDRPGEIKALAYASPPSGWLACDGRAISRAIYAPLFSIIGTTWGNGDGSTTFNIPDLRGRAMFGADNLGGTAANVLTGAGGASGIAGALASSGGVEAVTLTSGQLPSHSHTFTTSGAGGHDHGGASGASGAHDHGAATGGAGAHSHTATTDSGGSHSHTASTATGGDHTHNIRNAPQAIYGSGGQIAVTAIGTTGSNALTDNGGSHTHEITVNSGGAHQHNLTTDAASNHTHTITGVGNHTHTISGVADHTHTGTTANAGSGSAHANMPPGAVVAFAIKT